MSTWSYFLGYVRKFCGRKIFLLFFNTLLLGLQIWRGREYWICDSYYSCISFFEWLWEEREVHRWELFPAFICVKWNYLVHGLCILLNLCCVCALVLTITSLLVYAWTAWCIKDQESRTIGLPIQYQECQIYVICDYDINLFGPNLVAYSVSAIFLFN